MIHTLSALGPVVERRQAEARALVQRTAEGVLHSLHDRLRASRGRLLDGMVALCSGHLEALTVASLAISTAMYEQAGLLTGLDFPRLVGAALGQAGPEGDTTPPPASAEEAVERAAVAVAAAAADGAATTRRPASRRSPRPTRMTTTRMTTTRTTRTLTLTDPGVRVAGSGRE
jgi:hypothetical protein